jgi:uncharacterized membrane protein
MVRVLGALDALRGSFWFLPGTFTAVAVALAAGLLAADRYGVGQNAATSLGLYSGGAEGARSLLSVVAGSIVSVVALAFSITIVSLQLAVAQLGPRLLRNFVRDRGNQVVLGVFVATFTYSVVVLRTIRGRDGSGDDAFVPHLAITGAVALAMVSIALLIYFIHHAARAIQADRVIDAVARDLDRIIDDRFPEPADADADAPAAEPPPARAADAAPVLARARGYVHSIDDEALGHAAARRDVVVHVAIRPGEFVIQDEPLAWVAPGGRLDDRLARAIADAYVLGPERTLIQDVLFGIEQLTEVAERALASSHIDPTTAQRCIDALGAALARVGGRRPRGPCRRDEAGVVRVVQRPLGLDEIVAAALGPIRRQGADHPAIALRLLRTCARVAAIRPRPDLHVALLAQAVGVRRAADRAVRDPDDREAVRRAFGRVLDALRPELRRNWPLRVPPTHARPRATG